MPTISTNDLKNGTVLDLDGQLWQVIWFQHHKPGKGNTVVRSKLKHVLSGKVVDKNNKVVLNSPETVAALEYGKKLYETFVPGTLSWLDPNNNKAFLDGQCSMVFNGISVYYAAKTSSDPKLKEMVAAIQAVN